MCSWKLKGVYIFNKILPWKIYDESLKKNNVLTLQLLQKETQNLPLWLVPFPFVTRT